MINHIIYRYLLKNINFEIIKFKLKIIIKNNRYIIQIKKI